MDVLCELYPVEMTAIFASKRIFAAAATGGARTAELPYYTDGYNLNSLQRQSGRADVRLSGARRVARRPYTDGTRSHDLELWRRYCAMRRVRASVLMCDILGPTS